MKAETFNSRRFRALHLDWPSEALAQFSLLSSEDMLQVPGCQRAQNRLGLGTALFAAILAHGCNLLLTTMADVADIPYHHLTHVSDWYAREETIHRTIIALVDYHHALPFAAACGNGSAGSTDGIRFGISARSFPAQYHSWHFGPKRGVTVHDMTSDQYSHRCRQVIRIHLHEPHAVLAEIFCDTELPLLAMMTDTHSPSSPSGELASIACHTIWHCGSGVSRNAKLCWFSGKDGSNLLIYYDIPSFDGRRSIVFMKGVRALIDQDSVARFEARGCGKGTGASYLPWLRVQDVPSKGLSTRIEGWKTGRIHHFLSTLELIYYYVLEWSSIVTDIREQYPLLPLEETISIAQHCGIRHPDHPKSKKPVVFTTDFLLTVTLDGKTVTHARTVKYADALDSPRTLKKLEIERRYWEARGIDWGIVTEHDIPAELSQNVNNLHESWYLATYMSPPDLTRIIPVLTNLAQQNQQPLRKVATTCDQQLELEEGTSLKVAYYLIATRQWIIDMFQPLDPSEPLDLLNVAIHP